MKKITILIAIFIILLSGCGSSDNNNSDKQNTAANTNIKELSFLKTDDITLEVGESKSSSYVKVSVKDRDKFSPDDVLFISDNPDVATIRFTKDALTTTLYYEITAIGAGETEVYAKA